MDTLTPEQPSERRQRVEGVWRRAAFFGLTFSTALLGGFLMLDILKANGIRLFEAASLITFVALFTWIAGAFWTAIAGFTVRLVGRDPAVLHPRQVSDHLLQGRTAIVMPIYNEDTARVFAGLAATYASLREQAQARNFDFFVLSDTRDAQIAQAEELAWQTFVTQNEDATNVFYRRRAENKGRKSGNIAEFVRNWGGAYAYMIVLDADSIMSGSALVSLAQLMESHPKVGIVQALPLLTGRETLFARLLQFAVRLNGPMYGSGLAFWQLGDGNYWGHNAIIRLKPFAEYCALPSLRGKPPFGGEILSHDIVEAAFMRRAGYKIWLVPDIAGSWEEVPSNVLDFAARDRRWAQGNLQHVGVMPMRGLHWLSRVHMLTGILSYATSPMWLLVLMLSSTILCIAAVTGHQYFQAGAYSLFPSWPQYRNGEIVALLTMTITVLMLPKVLACILALKDRALRRAFGGARRLLRSMVLEQLLSMLLAPTMMLFHSNFVVRALFGRSVSWDSQPRSDRGVSWREAFARHKWHLALAVLWAAILLALAPLTVWWMLPVLVGMMLAIPFTVLTSRSTLGRAARLNGWLLTPEETSPPAELAAVRRSMDSPPPPAPTISGPAPAALPPRAPLTMVARVPSFVGSRPNSRRDVARAG